MLVTIDRLVPFEYPNSFYASILVCTGIRKVPTALVELLIAN